MCHVIVHVNFTGSTDATVPVVSSSDLKRHSSHIACRKVANNTNAEQLSRLNDVLVLIQAFRLS